MLLLLFNYAVLYKCVHTVWRGRASLCIIPFWYISCRSLHGSCVLVPLCKTKFLTSLSTASGKISLSWSSPQARSWESTVIPVFFLILTSSLSVNSVLRVWNTLPPLCTTMATTLVQATLIVPLDSCSNFPWSPYSQ